MAQYEYLMSSLPELVRGRTVLENSISTKELFLFCREELATQDFDQVRLLHIFNDIKNAVFFSFYTKQRQEDYASPGYYDEGTFMALKDSPGLMLPFLTKFYEQRSHNQRAYPQLPLVDELTTLFYQDMEGLTKPGFLRDYFTFTCNLRNIASALAFRHSGLAIASKLVQWGHAFETIANNEGLRDFGLSGEFPYVVELDQVLETGSRLDFEMALDKLLWDWLDETNSGDFFSLPAVLAYFVRLASIERWQKLTEDRGREVLDSMLTTVQRSIKFSIEFNKTGDR